MKEYACPTLVEYGSAAVLTLGQGNGDNGNGQNGQNGQNGNLPPCTGPNCS